MAHTELKASAILISDLDLYALFLKLLEKPTEGTVPLVLDLKLPTVLGEVANYLGVRPFPAVSPSVSLQEAQSYYISLFEVGLPAPPCPLNESPYNRKEPPTRMIRENLLFYRAFGLDLGPENRELPDHIVNQLEFLSYLTRLEEQAADPVALQAIRSGKRDFIDRRVLSWIPQVHKKLAELEDTLYEPIFSLLLAYLRADLDAQSRTEVV